jgi:hypothetical protein
VFVPDDERNVVLEIGLEGEVLQSLPAKGTTGCISDLVYSNGLLYCGRADEPRIIIIDVKGNKIVQEIRVHRNYNAASSWDPHWWRLPVISRVAVDKAGRIHVVLRIRHNGNSRLERLLLTPEGRFQGKTVTAASSTKRKDCFDEGVASLSGEWVYITEKTTSIGGLRGPAVYASQYQLAKVTLGGKRELIDTLSNFAGDCPGSIHQLVGYDRYGTLWALVGLLDPDPKVQATLGTYLVSWKGGTRQVHGRITRKPGNIRAPGCRHTVIGADGSICMLVAATEPKAAGEKVQLHVVRIH